MPKPKQLSRRSPNNTPRLSYRGPNKQISIRLTWQGKELSLALGLPDSPLNRYAAEGVCDQIKADIRLQRFTGSLEPYSPQSVAAKNDSPSTLDLWDRYIEVLRSEGATETNLSNQYKSIRSHLVRFGRDAETEEDARALFAAIKAKASTLNAYRTRLQTFGKWAAKQGGPNPFEELKSFKNSAPVVEKIPFTIDEIESILRAFKTHKRHWRYHDFALTLFSLGLRPSEAIGLKWCHINWADNTITVAIQKVRKPVGQKGPSRVERDRKNKVVTTLDLPEPLLTTLKGRHSAGCKPEGLIFTAAKGGTIGDGNFRARVWKPVLELAGVDYRKPYLCRHTMISHAIAQGATLPEAAYLAGHRSLRMVSEVYAKVVSRPKLPRIVL
jgi:integrase